MLKLWPELGLQMSVRKIMVLKVLLSEHLFIHWLIIFTYTVLVKIKTHFSFFSMISCKISWRNPGGISPAFLQEILCCTMKSIDFAFTAHFSPEISPGNFLFLREILNFTLRQFLHETSMCFYFYKHCTCIFQL